MSKCKTEKLRGVPFRMRKEGQSIVNSSSSIMSNPPPTVSPNPPSSSVNTKLQSALVWTTPILSDSAPSPALVAPFNTLQWVNNDSASSPLVDPLQHHINSSTFSSLHNLAPSDEPPTLCVDENEVFELRRKAHRESCLHGNSYCVVIDYFGLVCIQSEGFLGCIKHKTFIPFAMLPDHLTDKHKDIAGNRFQQSHPALLQLAISHLATVSGFDPQQKITDVDLQKERSQNIDVLPPPVECVQCPSCLHWFKLNTMNEPMVSALHQLHRVHLSRQTCVRPQDRCNDPHPTFSPKVRWTQYLFYGLQGVKSARFALVDTWSKACVSNQEQTGSSASSAPPLLIDTPFAVVKGDAPSYIAELGWPKYFLDTNADAEDLLFLVSTPRKVCSWMTSAERKLERRLLDIDQCGKIYLQDGNEWAETYHKHLRKAITIGSG